VVEVAKCNNWKLKNRDLFWHGLCYLTRRRSLMRSAVVVRCSLAAVGLAALITTVAQTLPASPAIPMHHLRLAWSLTQILIQL